MVERAKHFALHLWHRLSLSGLVGIIVIFIVFSLVAGSVQAIQQNFQRQLEVDRLAQEVALMKVEVETDRLQNQYYKTDEYLELQARDLLGLAAPDEKVVMLPKAKPKNTNTPSTEPPSISMPLQDRSNFEQWLYFLFSNKRVQNTDGS